MTIGYDPEGNYCTCSPDGLFKWNWNYCCYLHDRQYRNQVKRRKSRKQADIDLRECMKSKLPFYMHWLAWVYYIALRVFFGKYWLDG